MTETREEGRWIMTFTGRRFWPLTPRPEDVDLRDIAHALSLLCRFNGHCRTFYSVAEHSVRVSRAVPPHLALWGLLHDAAEAYLSDIPRPLKRQWPWFEAHEDTLLQVILARYGLELPMPPEVKAADTTLLVTEMRDLMPPEVGWQALGVPLPDPITPLSPEAAEALFLRRTREILPMSAPGLDPGDDHPVNM
jgi:hypothetical protein